MESDTVSGTPKIDSTLENATMNMDDTMLNNNVEILNELTVKCPSCDEECTRTEFVLRSTRPHKLVSAEACFFCGFKGATEEDYEFLDYGVRITCDFLKDGSNHSENMRRMVFTNNKCNVVLADAEGTIFEFICDYANVDCIEGLLHRGGALLNYAKDNETPELLRAIERHERVLNGGGFKLVFEDNSGFTKVCPVGKEYSDIQDTAVLLLNEENILYEKIAKQEIN